MARGRMLSQSIAEDIEFNEMSMEAQLLYMRSIPFLDRDGLINGHPSILFGKIAPLLPDMLPRMKSIIDEWLSCGLVISYTDGKTTVLYFKGFTQNQIGMRYDREPESQFGPPPGFIRTKYGLTKDVGQSSGNLPAIFRQSSGNLPPEEKRREEKRREENTRERANGAANVGGSGGSGDFSESDVDDVCELWRENMPGEFTPIVKDEIGALVDAYTAAEVDAAIRVAVKSDKRTMSYVHGVLRKRGRNASQVKSATGNIGISLESI